MAMNGDKIRVSIIVLTLNEALNIEKCLDMVFSQSFPDAVEVTLIDSSSDDNTLEIAKSYPMRIKTIPRAEFHHSRTRNLGATLSGGEILKSHRESRIVSIFSTTKHNPWPHYFEPIPRIRTLPT